MENAKEALNNTLPFLKEAGKYSVTATVKVLTTIIVFSIINLLFLIFGFYYFFKSDYSNGRLYFLIFMIIIALAATIFAALKMYNFVLIDAARVCFDKMDDFKRKFAEKAVDKFADGIDKKLTQKTPVNRIVNTADIVTDLYGKVPKIVVRIFNFIVGKIPMIEFSSEVKKQIIAGNKEEGVNYFVAKTNEFFKEKIFDQNSTRIIYITLFLTIVLQIVLVYLLKQ